MSGGIFCIENWSSDLRTPASTRDLLTFLERHGSAKVIHQRVATSRELGYYLQRFTGYGDYRVCYLAMHGRRGRVWVGSEPVSLETLIEWADQEDSAPSLDDRGDPTRWVIDLSRQVLYLGSCSSLHVSQQRLQRLRRDTNAALVCGYRRTVDWNEAAALELMLLPTLATATSGSRVTVAPAMRSLWKRAGDLMDALGFVSEPDYSP